MEACRAACIDASEAFRQLGLPEGALRSFANDHGAALRDARLRIETSGARMGGGADLDILYSVTRAIAPRRVLETGVAFGWSSLAILSALEDLPDARLVSIDLPYLGANTDHLVGLAVPNALHAKWKLLRGADRDRLDEALTWSGTLDLAHYDSDKSYDGRQWAYGKIVAALRSGGILISDDIQDNMSFLDFAAARGYPAYVLRASAEEKYIGIFRKT